MLVDSSVEVMDRATKFESERKRVVRPSDIRDVIVERHDQIQNDLTVTFSDRS
jgi:hypothetical protein